MKTQFVPPYMPSSHTVGGWNYRHYGVMDWCDDCCYPYYNYHENEFNLVRQYWSNHYKSFKRLYKKLYNLGFVCTNQKRALKQVLTRPLNKITFTYYRLSWLHFHWKPKLFLNTDGSITNNLKVSAPIWADIDTNYPEEILQEFSRKLSQQNEVNPTMCKNDKLTKAIQNAKRAEEAAKQAEELVKQYKRKEDSKYLVLVAYDNLWGSYEGKDACNFLIVDKHPANEIECTKHTYSLDFVSANDIINCPVYTNKNASEECVRQFFLNRKEAVKVARLISKNPFNNSCPTLMTKLKFIDTFTEGGFFK